MKNLVTAGSVLRWVAFSLALILPLVPGTPDLAAQPLRVKFDHMGPEQGLSQSTVYAIAQDAQGFIWFGTQDGLNRYDGYSIKVFRQNAADSNSISDKTVFCLLSDRNGDLWIGTMRGGVDRYVLSENKFYHHKHNRNDPRSISSNYVTSLFEDSHGNLWIGTLNRGVNILNRETGTFSHLLYDEQDTSSPGGITVWDITEDHSGNLWFATDNGVLTLRNGDRSNIPESMHVARPFKTEKTRALFFDEEDELWVGTWGNGVARFDKKSNSFAPLSGDSPSDKFITSIQEDQNGNLWVASYDGGLAICERQTPIYDKIIEGGVYSLFRDRAGITWIGTFSEGVVICDDQRNRFGHLIEDPGTSKSNKNNIVLSILEDQDKDLWVGAYGHGLKRYAGHEAPDEVGIGRKRKHLCTYTFKPGDSQAISDNRITSIGESSDGSIWVGTDGGGLNRYDKRTNRFIQYKHNPANINSLGSNRILALFHDRHSGLLWIGYRSDDIDSFDPETGSIKHYRVDDDKPQERSQSLVTAIYRGRQTGFWVGTLIKGVYRFKPESGSFTRFQRKNEYTVSSFFEDEEGVVWMGTSGGGLNRYDPATDSSTFYTTRHGLSNDVIYGILPDRSGNLWLSTNKGLSRFNSRTGTFRNFDARDGLQANEFNQGAYFASPSGELFFGGVNGLNAFFPEEIKDNGHIPPIYLTTLKVFDEVLPFANPIPNNARVELSYSQNYFSFEFVSVNYTLPEKNQYAYVLEGFDKDWHLVPSQQRHASYTNLEPGEYTLRVKGSNNDGVWNETGASINLVIVPPFWMTGWFRLAVFFLLVTAVGTSVRSIVLRRARERVRMMEKKQALEQERMRISRDLHDDLGARVTRISILLGMTEKNIRDSARMKCQMGEISSGVQDVGRALDEIVWSVNPKYDTLRSLFSYMTQYAQEYLEPVDIRFRLDIPPEIPDVPLTAEERHCIFSVVKESLNNTVKHAQATEVIIRGELDRRQLRLSIIDNGRGFCVESVGEYSFGLRNMVDRMARIGGACEIASSPGTGSRIMIIKDWDPR